MLRQPFSADRARSRLIAFVLTLAAALALGLSATAGAQTGFQASVKGAAPKPTPCANGGFFCGTADITGFGQGNWSFTLTALTQEGTCATYDADVSFALADGSTLALAETGTACGPGASNLSHASVNSFGHPGTASGVWSVVSATGRFSGLVGATGTDTLHFAGAYVDGRYSTTP